MDVKKLKNKECSTQGNVSIKKKVSQACVRNAKGIIIRDSGEI